MGFLSKLMKNPFVQMALPMALSYFMPGIGSLVGTSAISNPMMRSAAEQALLGYGTAKLTGSKHPEKAAMYAGLGSMPFSFMKAQGAANMYNKDMKALGNLSADRFKTEPIMSKAVDPWWDYTGAGPGGLEQQLGIGSPGSSAIYNPGTPSKFTGNYQVPEWNQEAVTKFLEQQELLKQEPLTAWDVLKGKDDRLMDVPFRREANVMQDMERPIWNPEKQAMEDVVVPFSEWRAGDPTVAATEMGMPEVDFYSKVGKGQKNLLGQELTKGETFTDFMPTIASQTAGWYGGRPTDEELWEDTKKRRRKELAFMYGIDESLMGGEMENPYYGGGGFWKDGGIATVKMNKGGDVSRSGPFTVVYENMYETDDDGNPTGTIKGKKRVGTFYRNSPEIENFSSLNDEMGFDKFIFMDTTSSREGEGIATLEMDAGGAVNGPGGPKDDVIDAKLSDGEFVMTAKAVENLGGGDRMAGAKRMYNMMNQLDPQSETVQESVIGV